MSGLGVLHLCVLNLYLYLYLYPSMCAQPLSLSLSLSLRVGYPEGQSYDIDINNATREGGRVVRWNESE